MRLWATLAVGSSIVVLACGGTGGSDGASGSGGTTPAPDSAGAAGTAGTSGASGASVVASPPSLSLGWKHACAVLDDGSVKCWGYNGVGNLGVGDPQTRGDDPGEMGDALPFVDLGGPLLQ